MSDGSGAVASAQLAGSVAGAVSSYETGQFNAKVRKVNAHLADIQAANAIAGGERDVNATRARGRAIISAQRAAFAGGGVVVDEGTAHDVIAESERTIATDVDTIRLNATLAAFGFRVSAVSNRAQAQLDEAEGTNRAAQTLLGGSAQASKTYLKLNDGA